MHCVADRRIYRIEAFAPSTVGFDKVFGALRLKYGTPIPHEGSLIRYTWEQDGVILTLSGFGGMDSFMVFYESISLRQLHDQEKDAAEKRDGSHLANHL